MNKYTITIKGDYGHQDFQIIASVDDDTIKVIEADILSTLQTYFGHQVLEVNLTEQQLEGKDA